MTLELCNINFGFNSEGLLLKEISLQSKKGTIYALMGENGSGKTTLFNIISGFLLPHSGDIYFSNIRINDLPPFRRNKIGIGRTFQDLRIASRLTVRQNIQLAIQDNPSDKWYTALLPSVFFKKINKELKKKTDKLLDEYFLTDVQNAMADEISYGQQKLLNLACCVANDADILLLDEPVAGINNRIQLKLKEKLLSLKEKGKTILLIEHDTLFVKDTADVFLYLSQGKLKEYFQWEPSIFEPAVSIETRKKQDTTNAGEPLLNVKSLNAGYSNRQVLFNVSLVVRKGEMVLLTGNNGSGKSTLLKAIFGHLLPDKLDRRKNSIFFNGTDISLSHPHELIRMGLVYIPQKNNIFERMTVQENLEMAGITLSLPARVEGIKRVYETLPFLAQNKMSKPFSFSGGEKQMLALGMALVQQPKMILLDEPGTGLSPSNFMKKLDILESLNNKGISFLIIEHRIKEFEKRVDRVLSMNLGQLKNQKSFYE